MAACCYAIWADFQLLVRLGAFANFEIEYFMARADAKEVYRSSYSPWHL